jgi:hypothetical protein
MSDHEPDRAIVQYERANRVFVTALLLRRCGTSHQNLIWSRDYPVNREVQKRYETTHYNHRDEMVERHNLRVDSSTCSHCGARIAVGCEHHRKVAA